MKKLSLILLTVLTGFISVSCSDSDDEQKTVVGITAVAVTPAGSAKSYVCQIDQALTVIENTNDSVDWDVMDASLKSTKITATATLGASVYYNNVIVGADGVEADATLPVTLVAMDDAGHSKSYTLKVVRAKTASGEDMLRKSSAFVGFPQGLLDFDMAVFNNKFYAITASLSDETENYQLFNSTDGINWTEVNYKTGVAGVALPEGQTAYLIGGEGARLQVFNNKLYVLGGARTFGADKYGNPAEVEDWGWGSPMKQIRSWHSYSTSDGETFSCDTVGAKLYDTAAGTETAAGKALTYTYLNTVVLGNRMYMKGGYLFGFGMAQGARALAQTTDGKNWNRITVDDADGTCDVARRVGDSFFSFKGKLWCVGGFTNFIEPDNMCTDVYSSADGISWTAEGTANGLPRIYHAKAVAADNVVYLVGGEILNDDNTGRTLSDKIYRSVDGVNWEAVDVPASFAARRNAAATVMMNNTVWIFGGFNTATSDSYGYPCGVTDTQGTDTWIKLIK